MAEKRINFWRSVLGLSNNQCETAEAVKLTSDRLNKIEEIGQRYKVDSKALIRFVQLQEGVRGGISDQEIEETAKRLKDTGANKPRY